jgi:hypothetical protein
MLFADLVPWLVVGGALVVARMVVSWLLPTSLLKGRGPEGSSHGYVGKGP